MHTEFPRMARRLISKDLQRRLAVAVAPPLASLLIRLLHRTCRKRLHLPEGLPEGPVIVVFWHGELLMQPYVYRHLRSRPRIAVMISEHLDGEIIARTIARFGLDAIRGSSRRGALRALRNAIERVRDGWDIAITPDGPRGPRHSVAEGVAAVARKTGVPVVAFNVHPERYWQLGSWDRFVIPRPFTTLHLHASEPFSLEGLSAEEARAAVHGRLMRHAVP